MTEWRETTLGAFSPLRYGANLPSATRREGEVPVVSSAGVIDSHDEALVDCAGLVVGRKGTVGSVTLVERPFWPIDTTFFVPDEPENRDLRFAYYLLSFLGLDRMNSDSAVPGLNRENAHAVSFKCPPLPEQRAIAGVLGALDDRIAANRRMAAVLEAMARTIFTDWFVDFGPTRAKMAGDPPYLAPEIWDLFPDRLNPTTGLPEGWEMKPLDWMFDIISGGTPSTSVDAYWDGSINWFSVVDAPTNSGVFVTSTARTLTQDGLDNCSAEIVQKFATIISARGTVGKIAMAAEPMAFNQSCYGLQGRNGCGDFFVYLNARRAVAELEQMAHGTVFSTITLQTFSRLFACVPDVASRAAFEVTVSPLFKRLLAINYESRSLARMRDLLLTPLMSGRLRVATAPHPPEDNDGHRPDQIP